MEGKQESFDDFDINFETTFVDRTYDLERIEQAWNKYKIFGFFGIRSVGKSRLVKEAISRFKPEKVELLTVDVRLLQNFEALYSTICATLEIEPEKHSRQSQDCIRHLVGTLRAAVRKQFIFYFDNTEDYQDLRETNVKDAFLSLCTSLVRSCPNVKIFVTSTTRIQFSQIKKAYFSYEVLPLNNVETRQLLHSVAAGVNFGECEDAIVSLSEGLPLLILMIGSELTEDNGMITPQEMVEFLMKCRLRSLSREFYPEEDRVADVYKKFIDRLEKVYRRRLTVLEYIPGSFTAEHARDLLGMGTTAEVKDQALIPIRRRHVLNYDASTRRFTIQGILKECIRTFYVIRNIPEIRARYVQIFSNVMQNISKKIGTTEYTMALAEFTVEQPNLQKLLTEVNYTRADTYHFFIQMATNSTELIERFMAGDGEIFYQGCLKAADMYGQERDKASVYLAVGSMYTNTKGILKKGAEQYEDALKILQKDEKSLQLATVYQRMGWNMLQQGQNIEAVQYFTKSLNISSIGGKEYDAINLQSMSSMGVTLTVLGRFDDAARYHFASLKKRRRVQGENHPGVGACLNNIGVMYEQKGDAINAAKYYKDGLEIKKNAKAPVSSLTASISNTANMLTASGQLEEAHKMLDDALRRLEEEKIPPIEPKALLYDTKGKAYRKEGKLNEAEQMFRRAVEIRAEVAPDNVPYMESLVHLADVNKQLDIFDVSLKCAKKAYKLKDKVLAAMPQNSFVKECLECMAEVYNKTKDTKKYRKTLEKIESELIRLEKIQMCHCNETAVEKIRQQLSHIREKLKAHGSEQ